MDDLNRKIKYCKLLEVYGCLLTPLQEEIMKSYFEFDLSLFEISSLKKVSRSAVDYTIKKASLKLDSFEDKLHLIKRRDEINKKINLIKNRLQNENDIKDLEKILEEINNGI